MHSVRMRAIGSRRREEKEEERGLFVELEDVVMMVGEGPAAKVICVGKDEGAVIMVG